MAALMVQVLADGSVLTSMYYKAPHANVPTPHRKHWPRKKVNAAARFNKMPYSTSRAGGTIIKRLFR